MAAPTTRKSAYRLDIQGLRAVAALLVATYHIWLGRVSGGVDVFFVVSAFFITKSLLGQVERHGRVQLLEFWGGLARRLLPTAMLVLLVVVATSMAWLPRTLWQNTLHQTLASVLYVENWQLAFDAVDYLAQGQSASPVQHYWALSVQGQFYFLWPILVIGALALAARMGANRRTLILCAFAAVFVVSLAFSVVATRANQTFTYFNTFARLWEFAAGALLAALPQLKVPRAARFVLGWGGFIGIVSCGLIFQVSRVFPGYAALWPVGCAVLIMMSGDTGSRVGVDRLLSLKPLVYLGGISYGIYLWHWPILIFYRWFTEQQVVGIIGGLAIMGAAIVLAAISTSLLENPVRSAVPEFRRKRRLVAFVAAALAPVLLVSGAWAALYVEQKEAHERPIALDHPSYPGARAREPGFRYAGEADPPLYPGMLAIQDDVPKVYRDGCHRADPAWQRENCVYGDLSSSRSLALVGGSHSVHWLPALELLARQHGWRVVVYSRSNCVFGVPSERINQRDVCREWDARTLEMLKKDRPPVIFTTSTRGSGAEEYVPEEFVQRWEQLAEHGIRVIAMRDTPWMKFWVPECLEMKGHDSPECAQETVDVYAASDPTKRIVTPPANVRFVDMSEYFCDSTRCEGVIGNVIVYRDDSHLTATYARTLAPMLMRKISDALPAEWLRRRPSSTATASAN